LKNIIFSIIVLFYVVSFATCKNNFVEVKSLKGKAFVSSNEKQWNILKNGDKISVSKFVKTDKSTAMTLIFPDGSLLNVGENSKIVLSELASDSNCKRESYSIKLFVGKLWAKVKKLVAVKRKKNFQINGKNAVAGVRGTSFGFVVNDDQSGTVMVFQGVVAVTPSNHSKPKKFNIAQWKKHRSHKQVAGPHEISKKKWEEIVLKAMQMVKFSANGKFGKPIPIGKNNSNNWYKTNIK
jgi:hypothetical protein